jgi:hypothetical protein
MECREVHPRFVAWNTMHRPAYAGLTLVAEEGRALDVEWHFAGCKPRTVCRCLTGAHSCFVASLRLQTVQLRMPGGRHLLVCTHFCEAPQF